MSSSEHRRTQSVENPKVELPTALLLSLAIIAAVVLALSIQVLILSVTTRYPVRHYLFLVIAAVYVRNVRQVSTTCVSGKVPAQSICLHFLATHLE